MIEQETKESLDIFPLMLALFVAFVVFMVLRPPILMLVNYAVAPTHLGSEETGAKVSSSVPVQSDTAAPILVPAQPTSLSGTVLPRRWTDELRLSDEMTALGSTITSLTNLERTNRRLGSLRPDTDLARIASLHSRDMVTNDYLAHVSQGNDGPGDGPAQRVAMLHRTLFGTTRENVALFDSPPVHVDPLAAQFLTQWMNSLGHRRNILSNDSTVIGVGCYDAADSGNQYVKRKCTQLFADVLAYAQDPIPLDVGVGATLPVRLLPQPGAPMPTAIVQMDLATDQSVSGSDNGDLQVRDGAAEGKLVIKAPPGLYGLSIHVPDSSVPGQYLVIPGPDIRVR
jgi:uncharacterized protein YkwD